jgi:hypothetical protein
LDEPLDDPLEEPLDSAATTFRELGAGPSAFDAMDAGSSSNSFRSDSKSSSGVATVRRERTARVAGWGSAELEDVPMMVSMSVALDARAETSAPVSLAMA